MSSTAVDPGGVPAKLPRGREAERLVFAEMYSDLQALHKSTTEFMERFQGRLVNHVLMVATKTFPASGWISENFAAPIGTVRMRNLNAANNITVSSSSPQETAPVTGVGVYVIPGTKDDTVSIGGTVVTFYGTVGDRVSYQIFTTGLNNPGSRS